MKRFVLAGLLCLALTGAACSSGDSPAIEPAASTAATAEATMDHGTSPAAAVTGSVVAEDSASDGKTITIKSVEIRGGKGFIAIHADANNAPGPVVGHSALLPEGTSANVKITTDSPITTGSYWPMLHVDSNTNSTYDFPTGGNDPPVKDASGAIVMKKITVTVS